MAHTFGPTSPPADRLLGRMMATTIHGWTNVSHPGVSLATISLRYLTHRQHDLRVQQELVESDFWTAPQNVIRERADEWLEADKRRLSLAASAFQNEAGVVDFADWSLAERDDAASVEARALWDVLHAMQTQAWAGQKDLIDEHKHSVLIYPDVSFQRNAIWKALDTLAEMRYVYERKRELASHARETPHDFREAHFIFSGTYGEIVKAVHKAHPGATASEIRDIAWCTYRTVRAPSPSWRLFSNNVSQAVSDHLPKVPRNEAQSSRSKKRSAN